MNGQRLTQAHDDQQGFLTNAVGAASMTTITIRDTGFPLLAFANATDDSFYISFQFSHRKKLNTNLDGVHLHAYLPSVPAANQTVLIDYEYTWSNYNGTIPATATWTKATYTHVFTGTEAQYSNILMPVITNIAFPVGESYSSILFCKFTRNSTGGGSDTYADDLGMVQCDAHFMTDRLGSANEATD
jgi:hypothetical protein